MDLPRSENLATTKLMCTMLAAMATFENERRKERQRHRIEAAKKAGKYKGRKSKISPKMIAEIDYLKEKKNLSPTQIAKIQGLSRATIYRVLKNELNYVPDNSLVKKPPIDQTIDPENG